MENSLILRILQSVTARDDVAFLDGRESSATRCIGSPKANTTLSVCISVVAGF